MTNSVMESLDLQDLGKREWISAIEAVRALKGEPREKRARNENGHRRFS